MPKSQPPNLHAKRPLFAWLLFSAPCVLPLHSFSFLTPIFFSGVSVRGEKEANPFSFHAKPTHTKIKMKGFAFFYEHKGDSVKGKDAFVPLTSLDCPLVTLPLVMSEEKGC